MIVRRILERVAGMVVVVWGAATAAFLVLKLVPGDPVDVMLGVSAQASPELKQSIRAELGLDQPLIVQYLSYLARLVRGDFGTSYQLRLPVTDVIGQQLGYTLQLAAASLAIALVIALVGAVLVHGRASRGIFSVLELLAISSPPFWIGLVLLSIFAFGLGWFPVAGADGIQSLVLPAVTIALPVAGILGQVLRTGLEDAEEQPFVTTARARGAGSARLVLRHTLRHAAIPALTLAGYIVGSLLGGAVVVESVFARPGLGRVALAAITNRDLPVVMGIIVFTAIVFVLVNLVVDLAYRAVDPRIETPTTAIRGAR
ncbi:ABC transporter permease [Agreia pratensis]|uniref:Peptide/nickel transport system permease protein n=1 Tax=Agreia pratensis TaxID=150121 RepID=A0A1X7L0I4_9MICO|nr:ABC transporter permease [Agreia pratensis]SMG47336.1 peptide/nickel transport system permease protein [Agreia pratensis]